LLRGLAQALAGVGFAGHPQIDVVRGLAAGELVPEGVEKVRPAFEDAHAPPLPRVQAGQVAYKSSISDVTITRRPDGLYAWTETEREYLGQACQGQPVKTETETGYMQIADRVTLSDGTQADRLYIWETTDNNRDKDLARIEGDRLYITGFGDNVDDRLPRDAQGWPTALNRTVWHQRQP